MSQYDWDDNNLHTNNKKTLNVKKTHRGHRHNKLFSYTFVMPSYNIKMAKILFFPHGFINRIKVLSTYTHTFTDYPRITSLFDEMKRQKIN